MRIKIYSQEWFDKVKVDLKTRHNLSDTSTFGISNVKATIIPDEKSRRFTARFTTDSVDRIRDVLVPQGMDASDFMKGAKTIFWNHNYDLPIGAAENMRKTNKYNESDAFLLDRPVDYQGEFFPDYAWAAISQKAVGGISVGWDSIQSRPPTPHDKELYGEDVKTIHSKWKLLEFSIAPLQCNVDAVITMVHKNLISNEAIEKLFSDFSNQIFIKPYPNEHSARMENPDKYDKIRRENDKFGDGIDVLWGILENGDVELQAIRFSADKFTADEARAWCEDHDYEPIEFEAATEGKENKKIICMQISFEKKIDDIIKKKMLITEISLRRRLKKARGCLYDD